MTSALPIDMVSDVVCPWCFIGKRRLEKAIALRPDIAVEVRFRPYFLNPWVPREGMHREDYLTTKFGSPERYLAIAQRVAQAAAAEGLTYNLDKIKPQPKHPQRHPARLPPPDSVGRRKGRGHEAAADGALFRRRRRSHGSRGADYGRGRMRPRCRASARTPRGD